MKTMLERVNSLAEEDQEIFYQMTEDIMQTLESDGGAAVLMLDKHGTGNAVMVTAGNTILVEPLMRTAGAVANTLFTQPEGFVQ